MRQGVKSNHLPMSLHTADGSGHRRPSRPVCVSRSRSTTAHSSLMIASTSASGVPHGMTTLPMSRAQFRLPTDLRFGCFRDHALCNGLRLLSCVSMSLLRAMTSVYAAYNALLSVTLIPQPGTWLTQSSRLPWYWILPPHAQPLLDFSGYVPRGGGRMGENIIMANGVGITHMNDSNPRGRSKPNVRLGISHQRFRMLYPRFKLLNWEMYLSYMNISPTAQMHVYVHKKQQQRAEYISCIVRHL